MDQDLGQGRNQDLRALNDLQGMKAFPGPQGWEDLQDRDKRVPPGLLDRGTLPAQSEPSSRALEIPLVQNKD